MLPNGQPRVSSSSSSSQQPSSSSSKPKSNSTTPSTSYYSGAAVPLASSSNSTNTLYYRFLQVLPNQESAERFRRQSQWVHEGETRLPDGSIKRSFRCGGSPSAAAPCPFRAYYVRKGSSDRGEVRVYTSTKGHNHVVAAAADYGRRMAGKSPKTHVVREKPAAAAVVTTTGATSPITAITTATYNPPVGSKKQRINADAGTAAGSSSVGYRSASGASISRPTSMKIINSSSTLSSPSAPPPAHIKISIRSPHDPEKASIAAATSGLLMLNANSTNSNNNNGGESRTMIGEEMEMMNHSGGKVGGPSPRTPSEKTLTATPGTTKIRKRRKPGPWLRLGNFGKKKKRKENSEPRPSHNSNSTTPAPKKKKKVVVKKVTAPLETARPQHGNTAMGGGGVGESTEEGEAMAVQLGKPTYAETKAEEKMRLKGLSKNPHTEELVLASPDLNKPHRWQEYEFFDSLQEWEAFRVSKGLALQPGRPQPAENYIFKRNYYCPVGEEREERPATSSSSGNKTPKPVWKPKCTYRMCLLVDERSGRCRAFESVPNRHTCSSINAATTANSSRIAGRELAASPNGAAVGSAKLSGGEVAEEGEWANCKEEKKGKPTSSAASSSSITQANQPLTKTLSKPAKEEGEDVMEFEDMTPPDKDDGFGLHEGGLTIANEHSGESKRDEEATDNEPPVVGATTMEQDKEFNVEEEEGKIDHNSGTLTPPSSEILDSHPED